MFLKDTDRDISDKEFEDIIEPHHKKVEEYLVEYIVPGVVAYYFATGYYDSTMYEEKFQIHINSIMAELFNYEVQNKKQLKRNIRKLLKIKYGLEVEDEEPLDFKKNDM